MILPHAESQEGCQASVKESVCISSCCDVRCRCCSLQLLVLSSNLLGASVQQLPSSSAQQQSSTAGAQQQPSTDVAKSSLLVLSSMPLSCYLLPLTPVKTPSSASSPRSCPTCHTSHKLSRASRAAGSTRVHLQSQQRYRAAGSAGQPRVIEQRLPTTPGADPSWQLPLRCKIHLSAAVAEAPAQEAEADLPPTP
jgi:hypothetical protein